MRRGILLDTGPLVALVNRRDQYHDWALAQWNQISPPMFTCEAVLSEVCIVLRGAGAGSESVLQMATRPGIPERRGHVSPWPSPAV